MPIGRRISQEDEEHEDFELENESRDFDADDDNDDVDDAIQRIIDRQLAKNNAVINSRMDSFEHRLDNVEKMVSNLSKLDSANDPKPKTKIFAADPEKKGVDKALDLTLGTAGRAMHAVVDTLAFVGESVVDIVTFGRAKQR